jgi:hypothetical protein
MKSTTPSIPKAKRISLPLDETPKTRKFKKAALGAVIDGAIAVYNAGALNGASKAAVQMERAWFIEQAVRAVAAMVVRDGELVLPLVVSKPMSFRHGRQ